MKIIYGTLIFFFYFIKYPLVIFLPIMYFYLDFDNNLVLNILTFISVCLIIKDFFFPHKNATCKPRAKR
jgi:hypothetical protein